ncbi:unnamed protein product [Didymodactylos carnosus]|uniref:Uncharacterized protein n=1 Tax=Didymodactylos carnosus TaxID=1234261 RepID=A0A814D5M3_9BILA|nr:unnamed protein product [Didymodactylos carnosus]CAF1315467.1 unnamed protein product [Didymodactylos carnosus]CAF3727013.1 unnamed protein product [Didymodactylos carnosus]CAF4124319.1 unnamed protein product [Didymodactylos carnosus]
MSDESFDHLSDHLQSIQIEDEDASRYYINYISESDEDEAGLPDSTQIDDDIDISLLPRDLIITPIPHELFTNDHLKTEFEAIFRQFDPNITVLYLKFFQRVRITFTNSLNALRARINIHEYDFHGFKFKTYFACPLPIRSTETYLRPPEPEKLFLISPPVSPPIGWEQKVEDPPVVDFNLLAAIAQLQPNESHEVLPSQGNLPKIIIHTCEDLGPQDEHSNALRQKLIKPTLVQTRRPPSAQSQS